MNRPIANEKTEALAIELANAIIANDSASYDAAMAKWKEIPMVTWELLAFKDRVHYLVELSG